jgi:hypothetical protein
MRRAPDASLATLASLLVLALAACGGAPGADDDALPAPDAAPPGSPDASPAPDAVPDGAPEAVPDATPDATPAEPTTLAPAHGFLGAELDVAITGDFAAAAPALVDFGPGVAVSSLAVSDGHVATVHLRIAPAATLGAHDVHVGLANGAERVLPAAFDVEAGLVVATQGPRTQGSLVELDLESVDPAIALGIAPFGVSAELPRVPDYPNLFDRTVVLIPPGLPAGPYQLGWFAPFASGVPYSAPDALLVEPFDPPLFAPGKITFPTLAENESHVYRVHAAEASVLTVQAFGLSQPALWIFDGAGRAGDRLRVDTTQLVPGVPRVWDEIPTAGEDLFVVVHASRYEATHFATTLRLDVRPAAITLQDDAAAHTTAATAQPTTGCLEGCVLRGVIAPGATQVYVVPPTGAAGAFLMGLRAGSADVLVRSGKNVPGDDLLRASQRLARPIATVDRFFFVSPQYLTVTNSGTAPQPYALSLRWQPLAAGEDPVPWARPG